MNLKTVAIVASTGLWRRVGDRCLLVCQPLSAVNSIREAIAQKDGSRFNQYVDYPQVREDLKAYVVTSLTQAATEESLTILTGVWRLGSSGDTDRQHLIDSISPLRL